MVWKKRAIFLDRDGVLIETFDDNGISRAIREMGQFKLVPGVRGALRQFRDLGFKLSIVTNQPDVLDGEISLNFVNEVNNYLMKTLAIDDVQICVNRNDDFNYKPGKGMIIKSAEKLEISLPDSFLIGDRWRDIGAGVRAGLHPILFNGDKNETDKLLIANGFGKVNYFVAKTWKDILSYTKSNI